MFIETSAKAGYNVKQLFRRIASALPGIDVEKPSDASAPLFCPTSKISINYSWDATIFRASSGYRANKAATSGHRRRLMLVLSERIVDSATHHALLQLIDLFPLRHYSSSSWSSFPHGVVLIKYVTHSPTLRTHTVTIRIL